jgi:type I restriction enzyme S subunit
MMEKRLTPQLRFPVFQDLWSFDVVNNRAKKLKVGFVGTCEPFYTEKENGILLIRTGNLKGVDIVLDDVKYVTSNFHQKNVKSQIYPDDLILARHGGKGEICLVPENFPTANCLNIVILRIDNTINSKFFQLIYGSASIQKQIIAVTAGSTQTVINTKEIGKLKFKFPTLPEQQKIASFLTDVDDKITKLTKKKNLLEYYKKGIMQKIFNQELRFKDGNGNDFVDWVSAKLGEVAKFQKGKGLPKSEISDNGKHKCIHYGELFTKYNELIVDVISRTNYNNKTILSIKNDVLMPTSDVTPNGLATASCLKESNIILGGDVLIIRQNIKKLEGVYLAYYIKHFRNDVMKLVSGSTVYHLYGSDMKNLQIKIPSLEEQAKIANFLSDIDVKIDTLNTKIENSKTFKKGLLQKMFV